MFSFSSIRFIRASSWLLILLAHALGATPAKADIGLSNGVAFAPISGTYNSIKFCYINVPAGASTLVVRTWGGLGNCDLYVQHSAAGSSLFRNTSPNNEAMITINSPATGRWNIRLVGRSFAPYSLVSLKASFGFPPPPLPPPQVLVNGAGLRGHVDQSTGDGNFHGATFTVPAGKSLLKIETSGGTGDFILIAKFGSAPHVAFVNGSWQHDAQHAINQSSATVETLTIQSPPAGLCEVRLLPLHDYANVNLKISVQ